MAETTDRKTGKNLICYSKTQLKEIIQKIYDEDSDWIKEQEDENRNHTLKNYFKECKRYITEGIMPSSNMEENEEEDSFWNDYIFKETNNPIASIANCRFSHDEKVALLENWKEVLPFLQKIVLYADEKSFLDNIDNDSTKLIKKIKEIQKLINDKNKKETREARAYTHKMVVSLLPQFLCPVMNNFVYDLEMYFGLNDKNSDYCKWIEENTKFTVKDYKKNECWYIHNHYVYEYLKDVYGPEYQCIEWRLHDKLKELKKEKNNPKEEITTPTKEAELSHKEKSPMEKNNKNYPLNQILFGPPGTGKTYNTIFKTLDILGVPAVIKGKETDSNWFENEDADREEAVKAFNRLKDEGRIVFTTFHQSMSYEDFIEGIKPQTTVGQVEYIKEDGIFCQIAKKAHVANISVNTKGETSVRFRDQFDNFIFHITELLEEGKDVEFESKKRAIQKVAQVDEDMIRFYATNGEIDRNTVTYARLMKLYDAGVIPEKLTADKIKTIIGGCNATYFWTILNEINKYNESHPVSSSKTIEEWSYEDIRLEYENSLEKHSEIVSNTKPYVFIIDEINRGNIANIFGELITLLEEDKRLGNSESMTCTLPYSKKEFGVPNSLYIIGTMNTADRSVEALDSALRRRFSFVEMMPKPELLKDVKVRDVKDKDNNNISLQKLLETINKRIEVLKDREHQIGHSYFMKFAGSNFVNAEDLKSVFTDKIIPLLQEYFYGDYEKILLVLGRGFIEKQKTNITFADNTSDEDIPDYRYEIKDNHNMEQALKILMNIKIDES